MPASPRFFCAEPLVAGSTITLSAGASRHVQVLRLQPGDGVTLFGGGTCPVDRAARASTEPDATAECPGGEFYATIAEIGRREVRVVVGRHHPIEREPPRHLQLAIGVPANERMDWLVEKATELGVARIQPLMTERSVVRLDPERSRKKTAHWTSIAIAACEQCGRNRVPVVHEVVTLAAWIGHWGGAPGAAPTRLILSLRTGARPLREMLAAPAWPSGSVCVLSGPEGGLGAAEEDLALQHGFQPVTLGPQVLRAETAALAALTLLA